MTAGDAAGDAPVALITGARRGLGAATALALAAAGFRIVVNDVVEDADAGALLGELASRGARARFLRHDIADTGGHADFIAAAAGCFGRIDCLVNNAGVQVARRVGMLEIDEAEFDRVLDINLRGTFFLTQHVARWMVAHPAGAPHRPRRSIVTITSANAALASVDKAAYCISKSALSMMNTLYALELGRHGIAVFEIRPGLMLTDMTASVREKYAGYVAANAVFGRWGEPDEVGRTVAALASGAIPYATGEILNVDGGIHIRRL
jgi:NAD(P)-dependent dehydrogenase (short-subunit alcohol dehydrogenase family)